MERAEFTLMVLLVCGDQPGVGAAEGPRKAELVQFGKRDFVWVKMPPTNEIWLPHKCVMWSF